MQILVSNPVIVLKLNFLKVRVKLVTVRLRQIRDSIHVFGSCARMTSWIRRARRASDPMTSGELISEPVFNFSNKNSIQPYRYSPSATAPASKVNAAATIISNHIIILMTGRPQSTNKKVSGKQNCIFIFTIPRKTLLQLPMLHRCAFLAFFQENHP